MDEIMRKNAGFVQPVRRYKAWIFQTGLIILILSFGVLTFFVKQSEYFPVDLKITRYLQSLDTVVSDVLKSVSWAGYAPQSLGIVVLVTILLLILRFRWQATIAFLSAIFDVTLNFAVKTLIHRPRPPAGLVHVVKVYASYSFPSGHVMFYTVFFGFICFLIYTMMKHSWYRTVLLILFGYQVLLIGVSRVYLGEHWASDSLGAYLLGFLALLIVIWFYRWGKSRFFTQREGN